MAPMSKLLNPDFKAYSCSLNDVEYMFMFKHFFVLAIICVDVILQSRVLRGILNYQTIGYIIFNMTPSKLMKCGEFLAQQAPSEVYWLGDNLYLNVTNLCPNQCYFCFRKYRNGLGGFNLKLNETPDINRITTEIQNVMNKKPWKELVFCGFGEPLARLDTVLEVSKWIKNHYPSIVVRVNTNGQAELINKSRNVAKELKQAGVDRICVSLNAHNQQTYDEVCKPEFENAFNAALEFVRKAKEERLVTEITAVTIPEFDIARVREIAADLGVKLRIRQYTPCFW